MRKTETLHCGGMAGGKECEACYFEPLLGRWIARVPSASRAEWVEVLVRVCPYCGVKLGVTPEGEPTREARIPRTRDEILGYYEDSLTDAVANHPEELKPVVGSWTESFAEWLDGEES